MDRASTCCFIGPSKFRKEKIRNIVKYLDYEVNLLINQGIHHFISGGALGFDLIAASLIISKKEMGQAIQLHFALPYKNQAEFWNPENRSLYQQLLAEADSITYVSEEYYEGCMKQRNRYMVDHSAFCICAFPHSLKRVNQTIKYARQSGVKVINTAK